MYKIYEKTSLGLLKQNEIQIYLSNSGFKVVLLNTLRTSFEMSTNNKPEAPPNSVDNPKQPKFQE